MRVPTLLITFFTFLFLLFHSLLQAGGRHIEFEDFNEGNKEQIYNELSSFMYTGSADYNEHTIRWIKLRLDSLLALQATDSECHPGPLRKTSSHYGDECTVNFSWETPNDEIDEYFAYYLNLDTIFPEPKSDKDSSSGPLVSLTVPTIGKHLFAINSRCQQSQSSFFIIIVEKDVEEPLFPYNELDAEQEPENRLSQSSATASFKVFPNLVRDSETQIHFNLPKTQQVSICLFEGNTGKLVKSIISPKAIRRGSHSQILATEELSPGIYYLLFQTESDRFIQKIVKI